MSNTARIFDIMSHKLASARYRPGQILPDVQLINSSVIEVGDLPPPETKYDCARVIIVASI